MKRKKLLVSGLLMAAVLSACTDNTSQSGRGPYEEVEEPETVNTPTPTPTPEDPVIDPGVIDVPPEEVYEEMELTIENVTIETEEHGIHEDREFPLAYVRFQLINLSDTSREQWPDLGQALDSINNEVYTEAIDVLENNYEYACELSDDVRYSSNMREADVYVLRADEIMLSYCTSYYAMNNGPHPAMWTECRCLDTHTGEDLKLEDIISGEDRLAKLPNIIWDNLVPDALGEDYEFSEEEEHMIRSKIEDIVNNGELVWGMDDKSILIYFDSDALMSYAFGPFSATIKLDEYPGLVNEWYLPVECSAVSGRVTYTESNLVN